MSPRWTGAKVTGHFTSCQEAAPVQAELSLGYLCPAQRSKRGGLSKGVEEDALMPRPRSPCRMELNGAASCLKRLEGSPVTEARQIDAHCMRHVAGVGTRAPRWEQRAARGRGLRTATFQCQSEQFGLKSDGEIERCCRAAASNQ